MTEPKHIEILEQGTAAWNAWRVSNPKTQPQLGGTDLSDMDLQGVDLSGADLSGAECFDTNLHRANMKMTTLRSAELSGANLSSAELYKADLSDAYLTGADLSDAYLAEATLTGAELLSVSLRGANLTQADLTATNLTDADLGRTDLSRAVVTDATLCNANLGEANVSSLRYGSFQSMRGHYYGIRGLSSAFGNALFVRDASDQDYLDTLERSIGQTPSPLKRAAKRVLFTAWSRIDYGRSLLKPAAYAFVLATAYGLFYFADMVRGWGLVDFSSSANSWITPFYFSVVTYTTLGFGDITPTHWLGEIIVVSEVLLGYASLGLLLSILANTVARRS